MNDTTEIAARKALAKIVNEADKFRANGSEYDAGMQAGLDSASYIAEQALSELMPAMTPDVAEKINHESRAALAKIKGAAS